METLRQEGKHYSSIILLATKFSGELKIMEPEKCDDLQWFPIDALPENTIHHERGVIENVERGITYSEIDAEHTFHNPSK